MPKHLIRYCIILALLSAPLANANGQPALPPHTTRSVKRVAKPTFNDNAGQGVFFNDVFKEALVGKRPPVPSASSRGSNNVINRDDSAGKTWSRLISAATLEDEVKLLLQDLTLNLTTVSRFRSDHTKIQKSFEQLSLLFGVVREYDGKVRWKADAAVAQKSFETAAVNARNGDEPGFASSKRSIEDLEQLVRGDRFPGKAKPPETLDWSTVTGHTPIMKRLQVLHDEIKAASSNEKDFKKQQPKIVHSAELIALMAAAVQQADMDYADDDDYVTYAKQMQSAASTAAKAGRNNNYEMLSNAVNGVSQGCADCHGDFR